ncbi:MAG: hypothetical protein GXP17_07260, partial [Gammaproteobacteria bacterium]|nr:hypothetical protein [Gammaproteobacteria bacterium]
TKTSAIKTHYVDTVDCETCGLRIPKTEAVGSHDRYFCCHQHRDPKTHAIGNNTE